MEKVSNDQSSVRVADEEIYLKENRYKDPKEISKQLFSCVPESILAKDRLSICDIGCAAGEFLYYCNEMTSGKSELYGHDVVPSLLEKAKGMLPDAHFSLLNADDAESKIVGAHDLITMTGVMSIFDEPNPSFYKCLDALKKGGCLIIGGLFNNNPIDTVISYKRANVEGAVWENGWNTFSKYTMESLMKAYPEELKFSWKDFKLPFKIDKQEDDPMRSWTESFGDNPHFMVNGANILVDFKFLIVEK